MADEKEYLTPHDYQMALYSQYACNISGLVHDLSRIISRIWNEAHRDGHGTDWVNNHPIVRLYVEQFRHLCRTDYHQAHDACKTEARKQKGVTDAG